MKKIGNFHPNNAEDGADYIGVVQTQNGKRHIKLWSGRNGNFHDYFSIYGLGSPIKCTKKIYTEKEYIGHIEKGGGLFTIIIKASDPEEKLPMDFDIYLEKTI